MIANDLSLTYFYLIFTLFLPCDYGHWYVSISGETI